MGGGRSILRIRVSSSASEGVSVLELGPGLNPISSSGELRLCEVDGLGESCISSDMFVRV